MNYLLKLWAKLTGAVAPTTANVLQTFHKAVEYLKTVVQHHTDAVDLHTEAIKLAEAAKQKSAEEIEAAKVAISNINQLIGK